MWFKLAGATFTKNLGTMSSLSQSYSISYTLGTGLTKVSAPGSVANDNATTLTATFTLDTTNYELGTATVTMGGTTLTKDTDYTLTLSSTTLTLTIPNVSGSVSVTIGTNSIGGGSTGDSDTGSGDSGTTTPTIPEGYTLLPTTKYALGVTSTGTGRVSANNAKRFSTADDTKANGILIPAGSTMHLSGLASGTYPLRFDYMYCTGNVACPASGSTTAIEGLVGTASNFNSSNYFPMNTSGADTCDIVNSYGEDYYFWIGFAGLTLQEGILAAYDTYTLSYKID